jgi:hypothetical protein
MIDLEKGKMLLARLGNEDEGEMIQMAKAISNIFQDDQSETLHVKVDWWKPNSGKYKGKILEEYWVPNPDDIELGSCNDPKPNSFLESLTTINLLSF